MVFHRPGANNGAADYLSCIESSASHSFALCIEEVLGWSEAVSYVGLE